MTNFDSVELDKDKSARFLFGVTWGFVFSDALISARDGKGIGALVAVFLITVFMALVAGFSRR
jgi:hypothetical protein